MRRIRFYTTASGRCPVQEFLDELPDKTAQKVVWVLRVVRDLDRVPANYLKNWLERTTSGKSGLTWAAIRSGCWAFSMEANGLF